MDNTELISVARNTARDVKLMAVDGLLIRLATALEQAEAEMSVERHKRFDKLGQLSSGIQDYLLLLPRCKQAREEFELINQESTELSRILFPDLGEEHEKDCAEAKVDFLKSLDESVSEIEQLRTTNRKLAEAIVAAQDGGTVIDGRHYCPFCVERTPRGFSNDCKNPGCIVEYAKKILKPDTPEVTDGD